MAAGVVVAFGGLGTAVVGAILIQAYLLFDCSDGELARWSKRTSAAGIYLDGVGHYLGEAALLAGLGVRAQGHLTLSGGYVSAGLAAALLAAIVKAETDNVVGRPGQGGLPGRAPRTRCWRPARRGWRWPGGWPACCGCTGSPRRSSCRC